jgi:hypothetical protein
MEAIVKVQLAQVPPEAPALIYDQERQHMEYRRLAKRDVAVMRGAQKVFRQAEWNGRAQKWTLGAVVDQQTW